MNYFVPILFNIISHIVHQSTIGNNILFEQIYNQNSKNKN